MNVPHGAHVIVADGEKYLLLRNVGDAELLDLRVSAVEETDNPRNAEQGTDRPGRYAAPGGRRSAVEQTDWKALEEADFATALAHRIDKAVARGDIEAWVLLAAPQTLGILRKALGKQAKEAMIGDIVGDYAHQTIEKIELAVLAI